MEANELTKYLPEGYEKACWETKAMRRKKRNNRRKDAVKAMSHSLIEVQAFAHAMELAEITDLRCRKKLGVYYGYYYRFC